MSSLLTAAALVLPFALGDSWMACVDYNPNTQACNGYPRYWFSSMASVPFYDPSGGRGQSAANNYTAGISCPSSEQMASPISNAYDSTYPMAQLTVGNTYNVMWPSAYHASVGLERGGVTLFLSTAPGLDHDDWSTEPLTKFTFDNCDPGTTQFNEAGVQDGRCYGTFTLPSSLQPGTYSLMWFWNFNYGEYYNSCADIQVVAGSPGPAPTPAPTPAPSTINSNYVAFECAPMGIAQSGAVTADVKYFSGGDNALILSVYPENSTGTGFIAQQAIMVGSTGSLTSVQLQVSVPTGGIANTHTLRSLYTLKVWMVDASVWQSYVANPSLTPWTNSLDEDYTPVFVLAAQRNAPDCESGGGGGGGGGGGSDDSASVGPVGAIFITIAVLLVVGGGAYGLHRLGCFEYCGCDCDCVDKLCCCFGGSRANDYSAYTAVGAGGDGAGSYVGPGEYVDPATRNNGWVSETDATGNVYYTNRRTGETSYDPPLGFVA